jgi:IS30 family transposase
VRIADLSRAGLGVRAIRELGRDPATISRELLDQTMIWNQRHPLRAFECFYHEHRLTKGSRTPDPGTRCPRR